MVLSATEIHVHVQHRPGKLHLNAGSTSRVEGGGGGCQGKPLTFMATIPGILKDYNTHVFCSVTIRAFILIDVNHN